MQNLNRFVTYVYSYRNYERDVNVGFAKVDRRGEYVRMEIQIRKKNAEKGEVGVYLLAGEEGHPVAIPIGSMRFERETGTFQGRFPAGNIGGAGYSFEQIKGLYLKSEREIFASQWVEEEMRLAGVVIWQKPKEEKEAVTQIEEEKEWEAAQLPGSQKEPSKEKNSIRATEEKPLYDWRYEWEKLDQATGNELVLGLALWTRNKGKS